MKFELESAKDPEAARRLFFRAIQSCRQSSTGLAAFKIQDSRRLYTLIGSSNSLPPSLSLSLRPASQLVQAPLDDLPPGTPRNHVSGRPRGTSPCILTHSRICGAECDAPFSSLSPCFRNFTASCTRSSLASGRNSQLPSNRPAQLKRAPVARSLRGIQRAFDGGGIGREKVVIDHRSAECDVLEHR